ncbi:ATP-dependent RecD-like DNA helicase [[Clostridium] symbiosum]|uniref:SF1B family DNA helicase RecD2 n=1 Tax=Clostridium symbiosum TaxID=1512 RepID=UPI00210CADD8|nr:ATP-dependent RecD-like DNA helicase [[Clostridium] symbiosum]MCQ4835454.1 ATP-dependent RecD-like DNA helicase [[Clostridium] symbiosum]
MAAVKGYVEKIKYRNEDNGYSVLSVTGADDGEEYILVGNFSYISEGELVEAAGRMTEHPIYGEQLAVESYELKEPEDTVSMERYLGSGAIKGIGAALATRIVKKFKTDTFRIMEEEPERLAEIKGISEKMAMAIGEQVGEKKDMRQAMMFLQNYGISMNLSVKIYQEYGPAMYNVIKTNPYKLADDIPGVGFKMADEIASKVGIFTDSDFRIKSGILYTLLQASANGHTYLPEEELEAQASELLKVEPEAIEKHLMDMQMDKRLVVKNLDAAGQGVNGGGLPVPDAAGGDEPLIRRGVYAAQYYYTELNAAKMLHDLNITGSEPEEQIRKSLAQIQEQEKIELDELQIQAVIEAVNCGLLIITGGPGTGKTTTINTIIRYFEMGDMEILLAAPTGRAAKRMTEATGYEARTIHRLLELSGMPDPNEKNQNSGMHFERNEENPLDADVIIIDEMSMVDIHLLHALLKAVNVGTRLILVGDVDQLPSVGPGNVLRDMIDSECFHVVKLTRIFRQAAQSDIIVNAHKINAGEKVDLAKRSRDFLFIRREEPNSIINAMITLVKEKLPAYVNADVFDIQIMTPMRKGALGVDRLNTILQDFLNPPSPDKPEKEAAGTLFRLGDKVMQIKNNYQIEWRLCNRYGIPIDKGTGVFNGDTGVIREINLFAELLTVEFDEGKLVDYSFRQLEELELAYAITIHKSQGSEYPAVVIPVYSGPRMMMTRNLIYTAVTRARSCVCLVGIPQVFQQMVDNAMEQKRYSGLKARIEELII